MRGFMSNLSNARLSGVIFRPARWLIPLTKAPDTLRLLRTKGDALYLERYLMAQQLRRGNVCSARFDSIFSMTWA